MPITHALILDPWLEPLPSPEPSPYSSRSSDPQPEPTTPTSYSSESTLEESQAETLDVFKSRSLPHMLVLNSDPFTLWDEHFARLKGVVAAWEPEGRRVLTLGENSDHVTTMKMLID